MGPDGALYITDDKAGRIWRVTYVGDPNAKGIQAAPAPATEAKASPGALPPEGVHPDAGVSCCLASATRGDKRAGRARQEESSMARSPARPAPDVTALTAWARRWERI